MAGNPPIDIIQFNSNEVLLDNTKQKVSGLNIFDLHKFAANIDNIQTRKKNYNYTNYMYNTY